MNILPEIFDKHAKYKPWLWEKYGDTFDDEKYRKRREEGEKENKYKKDRMMHGKKKVGHSNETSRQRDRGRQGETGKKRSMRME